MPDALLDRLRRWPDVEAPNLYAVDAADRLLLDAPREAPVAVLGDHYGALTLGALAAGTGSVRTHTDRLTSERAILGNAERLDIPGVNLLPLDRALEGARTVLLALPRSLPALDELAAAVARHADPSVTLLAAGRVKHMTVAQNDVLRRHFTDVSAGLARQKSRLLTATGPVATEDRYPQTQHHADLGLVLCAHGAAFAGTAVDPGSRFLLEHLPRMKPVARDVVDLGCGTGLLACALKRARPETRVLGTDESQAAVDSCRATARANGLDISVMRDLGLSQQPDRSADLVLLNPPFHSGATVVPEVARPLFADAARVLRPGGELWTVFNSHLDHKAAIRRVLPDTEQIARNKAFTVTRSVLR